jgi:hypothetical protein
LTIEEALKYLKHTVEGDVVNFAWVLWQNTLQIEAKEHEDRQKESHLDEESS